MGSTSSSKLSSGRLRLFWALLVVPFALMAAPLFAQTAPLNDTGQTLCFDNGNRAECTAANTGDGASHPRQDGRFGRDAQAGAGALTRIGSGEAGFDFTRICNSGQLAGSGECPADPALGAGTNDWACTRDNVTGLIWEVKTLDNADALFNFADASAVHAAAVNGAGLCGFEDWRLPTRRELLSIVHHGRNNPAIDPAFFPNTRSFYWSSNSLAPDPVSAWGVDFGNGSTGANSQTFGFHVRLVSGTMPPEPAPRFVDNLDGTVTDPATGLMWDRCSWGQTGNDCGEGSASLHNWQAALGIAVTANTLNHRGYNDWRLPNRTELESLVDIDKATAPTIDTGAFPNTRSAFFWSSTVFTPDRAGAWLVIFGNGSTSAGLQLIGTHVRLVRSGQSFDTLAAAALGIITEPSSAAQSGVIFPQQPVVEVRDANGNPVQVAGTDITAAIDSGGGTLTGTTTVATDANGRATFTDLAISGSVGDRTLSFSAGSLTPATSGTITLSAGPAAQMAVNAGDGQSATAGTAVATAPSVIVRDANDNPVQGVSVNFAVASGDGSVTGAAATTDASGIATVGSWTLGATAGENTLTASAAGLTDVTFTATGTAGTATQIAINVGDGQSATAGTAVATAPSVIVRDANNNPVSGVDVTFAVASGDGSVTGAAATTNASGIATVGSWTLGTTAGENTLTASAAGLPDVTFTATGTAGTATQMAVDAGNNQSAVAGEAVTVAPSVRVADANDNPVEGVAVTFAASDDGMVDPTTPVTTDADGIATVTSWTLGTTARENTLTATVAGIAEPVIFTAMAIPVVPAIPVPTLGSRALLSLMLLMLVVALSALGRREQIRH